MDVKKYKKKDHFVAKKWPLQSYKCPFMRRSGGRRKKLTTYSESAHSNYIRSLMINKKSKLIEKVFLIFKLKFVKFTNAVLLVSNKIHFDQSSLN